MKLPEDARKVFHGVMFDVYQWDQEQFDGSTKVFEAVKRTESVQLIATTKDNELIILEEEQPLVGKFLSLPGGICESKDPVNDAKRELLEETGMSCEVLELWQKTGFSSKVIWDTNYYFARGCTKISNARLDSGEKIMVFKVSFDDFIEKVLSDSFRNKEFSNIILKLKYKNMLDDFKKLIFN